MLGSSGIFSNTELRLPAFSPTKLLDKASTAGDLLQFGGFFDYAKVREPKSLIGGQGPVTLASLGVLGVLGVLAHYSLGRHVQINLDLGWRLKRAPQAQNPGHYAAVSVTVGL